jgi:hypothetical protein
MGFDLHLMCGRVTVVAFVVKECTHQTSAREFSRLGPRQARRHAGGSSGF